MSPAESYAIPGLGNFAILPTLGHKGDEVFALHLNGVGMGIHALSRDEARTLLYRYIARSMLERHGRLADEMSQILAILADLGDESWNLGAFRQRIKP